MASTDLRIIIAGSGIAGLSAAIALELAGLNYIVLEQEPASRDSPSNESVDMTPGGAIQVGPTALHFLRQLGVYEEIQKFSKPVSGFSMNEHDMNYLGRIDMSNHRERYGHHTEVMARSHLHALLLQRVPPKRITPGKILGMIQDKEKVVVRCSDGSTHEGDILIAADGAFSNVRHTLYWNLDEKKQLPQADAEPMSADLRVISGCTKQLDPQKYPVLLDAMSEIQSVQLPDKPYTIWFVPLLDNRIAWDITQEVTKTAIRQGEASTVYHWRPRDIEEAMDAVKGFECPYGGKVGDLIETSATESMFFHMTEERLCETWYGGRTVLLGDACHKGFHQPASEAIVDAVTLVNFLTNMTPESMESLTATFKEYQSRRFPTAKAVVEQCTLLRQVFAGRGRAASLKRNFVFNYMPEKMRNMSDDKRNEDRPQLWFLPQVQDQGVVKGLPNLPTSLTDSTAAEGPVKLSLEAAMNAALSSTSSAASSPRSPRSPRGSWSSFSRPAFSMPSAPSVSLFSTFTSSSSSSLASTPSSPNTTSSRKSSMKSPRGSVTKFQDDPKFGRHEEDNVPTEGLVVHTGDPVAV
ncbi:MAG: hypothetical protein J3Q66DRAFT_349921 [Benniella sp.]|nr:MAG: hypothetical protein J3Q66DRAFT_349921 [Benniella sp.]